MSSNNSSNKPTSLGIITGKELPAVKAIDKQNEIYYCRHPRDTHTAEELASVHRAVHFTNAYRHEESMAKMEEVETIERILPRPIKKTK